jgi:hypothetical protein
MNGTLLVYLILAIFALAFVLMALPSMVDGKRRRVQK